MREGAFRTIAVAFIVCAVCSLAVSGTAVLLQSKQEQNRILDRKAQVLEVVGLSAQATSAAQVESLYATNIVSKVLNLSRGQIDQEADPAEVAEMVRRGAIAAKKAPANQSGIQTLPEQRIVYFRQEGGQEREVILPVEGLGLWGVMRGYIAIATDGRTIQGLTFYEHKETPGLGAEVDNPKWKSLWAGRKVYDEEGSVQIQVAKGQIGSPQEDPYRVDAISGATLTGRGVSNLLEFWLGPSAYGPFLAKLSGNQRE